MRKKILFLGILLSSFLGFGQTTLGIQDFEASPATPTMTFSGGSLATGNGNFPNDSKFVSGSRGRQVNNGTQTILFSAVNALSYTNITLSFRLASFAGTSGNGADGSDEVYVDISTNNGASWSRELEIQGNNNAKWSFDTGTGTASISYDGNNTPTTFSPAGGGNRTTDGYTNILVNNLPNSSQLRVRLVINNNSSNEYWVIDDVEIEGLTAVTPDIVLSSSNPATSDTNFNQGTDNNVIYNFDLSPTAANATFTELDFTTSGSYAASNLNNFKLWYSADNTFDSSTDTFLENITTTLGPGNHTFSGFSQTINEDATGYFFITVDLPCNATNGNTINVNAVTTSGLTFSPSANKSGTAFNGGTHTFQTVSPANATAFVTQDCENNGTTINWNDPLGCFDNVLVFATDNPAGFTAAIPSGNGVAYAAATSFGGGTAFDGGFCVYKGTGNTENITNLVNGTTYTFKIFTRNDTTWSNGTTVTCTPNIGYCNAGPTSNADSEIENVTLNGENNNISNNTTNACTGATGGFINDFTAMSADLEVGATYTLTVEFGDCSGGAQYNGAGGVWIDWNNDGDFDDANETINTLNLNVSSGNVIENFSITVPALQPLGFYRMRIVQEEGGNSASISPCGTFNWGSVEDYSIEIINACTPTHSISSIAPTSGPEGTEITITGSGFTVSTTALFDGIAATTTFVSNTEIIVEVPTNATTGVISVTENSCSINTSTFTVIDFSGSCSSPNFSDLIISEVYDRDGGNVWYMELYNPTNTAIDLDASGTDYAIERFGNIGDVTPSLTIDLTGTVPANSVFTISLATDTNPCNTISYDLILNVAGINENDKIILTKNGADHDVVHCPNNPGYSIIRDNTSNGPSTTFNSADWNTSNSESCSDLGSFTVPNALPTINTEPSDVSGCTQEAIFTVNAVAGNGGSLTYQWYFNDRVSSNWAVVNATNLPNTVITGETSNELTLGEGFYNYSGYQFYCLVTEDGSCSLASDAVQLNVLGTVWNGTAWSNGIPNASTIAVLNDDFDTSISVNGEDSFTACTLIIDAGATLNITNAKYIQVYNDINLNGSINVSTEAALVQVEETASFNLGANAEILFSKETTPLQSHYDYTYWSSPLENATIGNGLSEAKPGRKYLFNASQFNDILTEDANTGTFTSGFDDIDDDGNDWENVGDSAIMQPGNGYAAMQTSLGFVSGNRYSYQFIHNTTENSGGFNSGPIAVDLYVDPTARPAATDYKQWNLLGNPYPCAISTDEFFADNNANLEGVVYLWTHRTLPDENNSGNEQVNFSKDDYAMINGIGGVAANNGGAVPKKYIASGQGFFAISKKSAAASTGYINVPLFNNSMRVIDNNDAFFRTSENEDINIRLSLTSDNGAFNQILIGYNDNASKYFDSMYFDAPRNLSTNNPVMFYSIIEDNVDRYAIQGRHTSDLNVDESIPLGIISKIDIATTYTITLNDTQGEFFNENNVYLHDSYLNLYHNLSLQDYHFIIENTDNNEFNDRFEIVFKDQSLSTETFETNATNFTIVELDNDQVAFNTNSNLRITNITIIDVLGREVSQFKTNTSKEIITLSQLSSAPYIAKVKLSNGQVITKKAIKK